jgi:hypothetical protein
MVDVLGRLAELFRKLADGELLCLEQIDDLSPSLISQKLECFGIR